MPRVERTAGGAAVEEAGAEGEDGAASRTEDTEAAAVDTMTGAAVADTTTTEVTIRVYRFAKIVEIQDA